MITGRIEGLTELEALWALQAGYLGKPGGIAPNELVTVWGDYPRTRSVLADYYEWQAYYKNPDLYWDKIIANFKERLQEAEENKRKRIPPPMARY